MSFILLIIIWSLIYSIVFLALFIFLKRGLWKFFDKIVPFSVLRENHDDSIHIDNLTFQGQCFWLFILSCILGFSIFFFPNPNHWVGIGLFLMFFIPGLILLLRMRIFNDNNVLSETGLGYDPLKSWIFSFFCGSLGFTYGFFGLGLINTPIYIPLILIILAFISCIIPMFPDHINKFLSYDIRSEKGISFMNRLTFTIVFIQIMIIMPIILIF